MAVHHMYLKIFWSASELTILVVTSRVARGTPGCGSMRIVGGNWGRVRCNIRRVELL